MGDHSIQLVGASRLTGKDRLHERGTLHTKMYLVLLNVRNRPDDRPLPSLARVEIHRYRCDVADGHTPDLSEKCYSVSLAFCKSTSRAVPAVYGNRYEFRNITYNTKDVSGSCPNPEYPCKY